MNWIRKLFFKSEKQNKEIENISPLKKHEQLLIDKAIDLLKHNPECFSAKWFSGNKIDASIQDINQKILIMINTGQITEPIHPEMTEDQRNEIKKLLKPIVEKDSKFLIEKLSDHYPQINNLTSDNETQKFLDYCKKERLSEGFIRTNNKTSNAEKPKIKPAPQKPKKKE